MTKDQFYLHLSSIVQRQLSEYEQDMLDITCVKKYRSDADIEFIPLADAAMRATKKNLGRWLYDKKSMTWIINVALGAHEMLAGTLYNVYTNNEDADTTVSAEHFITKQYGFYVSGSMNLYIPLKDDDYILSPEENLFNLPAIKGPHIWRGIR